MAFSKKSFFGAALGTMVEYYDYALFIIFLPILSPLFFPASTVYQSLIKGYFILLIVMLARPLGGIAFGYLGDALGRRNALLSSMYGIAFATFLIGVTPAYATLGVWATVIVVLAKAIQIFCFGGEYNGAGIYVVEHTENQREGFMGSLLTATTLFGSLIASLIGIILTAHFMPSWSWRIAFIMGGLFGLIGILYRKNLIESPGFQRTDLAQHSLAQLIKKYPRELTAGIFIGGFATLPFTTVLAFVNPVLMSQGFFTSQQLMLLQTLLIFIAIIALISAGIASDRASPAKIMRAGCWFLLLFSYPLSCMIDQGNLFWIIVAEALLIIANEILLGPSNAYLKNLFTMQYRYRGSSLSFCVGMSLVGGLTPIVDHYLYQLTGHFSAIAIWMMLIAVGTLLAIRGVTKKALMSDIMDNSASYQT